MAAPGLTPDEQAELTRLEAEEAQHKVKQAGAAAVSQVRAATVPPPPTPGKPLPFSLTRTIIGGLRDATQDIIDTSTDVYRGVRNRFGNAGVLASQVVPGLGPLVGAGMGADGSEGANRLLGTHGDHLVLPEPEGSQQAGTAERFSRSVVSFLTPYSAVAKGLGVAKAATFLGRAGLAMVSGAAVDFTKDPMTNNLANAIQETFGIHNDTLKALTTEQDDDRLMARFKAAAVNAPLGLAAEGLFESGFRAVKAYRDWKGGLAEAEGAVKSAREDLGLDPKARDLPAAGEAPAAAEGEQAATGGAKKDAGPQAGPKPFDATEHAAADAPKDPSSFEDILTYLKSKTDLNVDEEMLSQFAKNLVDGSPENALAKMGIDPAKLDFSVYDDPALLGRLQRGLAEVYETIASRLGRSNQVVSEAAINSGARALATTADALKDLHGNTSNLAEQMMAARLFVGAHAHKLLSLSDEAAKAIGEKLPNADEAWGAFMEAFHRHAYYLGALRGAGSEVGRALRSLQMVAKVGKASATRDMAQAVKAEAKDQAFGPEAFKAGASHYLTQLTTDADKLLAIQNLKRLDGDVGDLTRHVRVGNMTGLQRVDMAFKETVGNLFSIGTASANVASGAAMLGMRAAAKAVATMGNLVASPFGRQFAQEARVSAMDTWAYVDGAISSFRTAYAHTVGLLEREGMAEAATNLDALGFNELAAKAAKMSLEGAGKVGDNFERAEMVNDRWFSMKPDERASLQKTIDETDMPTLLQQGLGHLVSTVGSAVNAAGTMSRAGTIMFINAPDQFMGTLAARAGAQSAAVRIAAREAAELGLEGKDLSKFLKARMIQLTQDSDGWAKGNAHEMGQRDAVNAAGTMEAKGVLFQDALETPLTQGLARGLTSVPILSSLIIPFVKTPLRILERTAIDHTPLGLFKDRVRQAILAGGPAGQEAMARIAIGMLMTTTGYALASDRSIIGDDNGSRSSARLDRPAYTFRVGDDTLAYNRLDPIGELMGFGADVNAYFEHHKDDPQAPAMVAQMFEATVWGVVKNALSKTWLQSVRNLADLAGATSDEDSSTRWAKYAQSLAARFVPGSGLQRSVVKGEGYMPETASFIDALMAASMGASRLPVKRDQLLGRPLPVGQWDRLIGIQAGSQPNDKLRKEMEALSFDLPTVPRTVEGVRLNATQYSRLLELRGQVVEHPETGMKMEDTLRQLIAAPAYQQMNRAARVDIIRAAMDGYSKAATDQLLREDHKFAHDVLQQETWKALELKGASRDQKVAETARLAQQLGLQPAQ